MKKIIFFGVLIAFYLITQMNFTGFGSTGKKSCEDIKIAAKKCATLLNQHDLKLKKIEMVYKLKSPLDYSVNLTAENSAFVETYQTVKRDADRAADESERSPASACEADEKSTLKTCIEDASKIYKTLVPN